MALMTLMTGPERRRRWDDEERQRILEAAFAPGAVVAEVGRQFDVATSLIYKWRRQAVGRFKPAFAPAMVINGGTIAQSGVAEAGASIAPIQVAFSNGARVSIEASAPAGLVAAVLQALR